MITQNMVGGWYVDAIVSELVPLNLMIFLHNDGGLFSTLIQFFIMFKILTFLMCGSNNLSYKSQETLKF